MAVVVLPIDADVTTGLPAYSGQATREALAALMPIAPAARPLGATSGVRAGTSRTTVTASSTVWTCAAHAGVVDAQALAICGPYLYATDGTDTGAVTAANATNPRVDIVYVQINDATQDGSGLRSGTVNYLAGTAAASPVAPTTPARSLLLATIAVPVSGGGAPVVTWVAPIIGTLPFGRINKTASQNVANVTVVQVTFAASDASKRRREIGVLWRSGIKHHFRLGYFSRGRPPPARGRKMATSNGCTSFLSGLLGGYPSAMVHKVVRFHGRYWGELP